MVKAVKGTQAPKGALERISDLELNLQQLIEGLNQAFQNIDRRIAGKEATTEALIHAVGVDKVQEAANELMRQAEELRLQQAKESVAEAVKDGRFTVQDAVDEKSFIVATERTPEGELIGVGRVQQPYPNFGDSARAALLGKRVGDIASIPGADIEILEIYAVHTNSQG